MRRRRPLLAIVLGLVMVTVGGASASRAQPAPARVPRVGYLGYLTPAVGQPYLQAFRQRLAELKLEDGRDLVIDERYAEGRYERLPELADALVRSGVDVLVAPGPAPTLAATRVTTTVPIVMMDSGDPVAYRIVASLERPGGNVTGIASIFSDLAPIHLDLLRRTVPGASRVAVLWNPTNLAEHRLWGEKHTTARVFGWQLQTVPVRAAAELDEALAAVVTGGADALYSLGDPLILAERQRIVAFALRQRLPSLFGWREFVDAGGLLAYGPNTLVLYRQAAGYVERILRGARPADLAVEPPARYELVVNLRTARALGLTIPPSVLAQADAVIE